MRKTGSESGESADGMQSPDTESTAETDGQADENSNAAGFTPQIGELIKTTVSEAHNSI